MKLYMFRTVRLSIIVSLFTVHSAMLYVIEVCRLNSILVLLESCLQTGMTYTIPECTQDKTPDDGQRYCPKHVEFHGKINL
jgi:hypothetical protein